MITWEKVQPSVLALANEIIYEHHPWLAIFKIGFVFRSEASLKGGAKVLGNTSKVSPKYSPHLNLHFLIWLAQDEWDRLTTIQRKALIDHELCHINMDGKLVSHDIEEFGVILKRYGLWKSDLFRLQPVFEQACQLRLPVDEPGGVVAVDPGSMAEENELDEQEENILPGQSEPAVFPGIEADITTGFRCHRCGDPNVVKDNLCLACLGDQMAEDSSDAESEQ